MKAIGLLIDYKKIRGLFFCDERIHSDRKQCEVSSRKALLPLLTILSRFFCFTRMGLDILFCFTSHISGTTQGVNVKLLLFKESS